MHGRQDVVDFGGSGPPIVLLHALMGRARTWSPVARWLTDYGHVLGLDAAGHGAGPRGGPWTTERFVADLADFLRELDGGPAVLVGHSMGALHALVTAGTEPSLVRAVISEDIAPDQRGRTVESWRGYFATWPDVFASREHVREFFGDAGAYFAECVVPADGGFRLTADFADLYEIAGPWGERSYWSFVDRIRCPLLVLEAEFTAMPAGQQAEMARRVPGATYLRVPGAGHVVHESAAEVYRGAVEAFLSGLPDP